MKAVFAAWVALVCSRVITFSATVSATQVQRDDFLPFGRFAMYSNRDVPGKFNSSITLEISTQADCEPECANSTLVLAVAAYSTLRSMQKKGMEIDVCCWMYGCGAAVPNSTEVALYWQALTPDTNLSWTHSISQTDLYDVFIALCKGSTRALLLSGSIQLLNPYGYLPGETYPYLHFFFIAMCAYGLLLGLWTALLYWHWTAAIPLQKCYIPWLLLMCASEDGLSYLSWNYLNEVGITSYPLFLSGLVGNSIRNTLARVLMLVVSMGYGITIPQLKHKGWITALGVLFFAANLGYIGVGVAQHFAVIPLHYLFLATLPLSLLATVFYMWTFLSLTYTMRKLHAEQQPYKLAIFQRLTLLFVLVILASALWFLVECYYRFTQDKEDYWQILWRFEAAWHVLFFITIAGIIAMWRPTAQSKLLAFTLELVEPRDVSASDIGKQHGIQLHHIGYEGESS